MYKIICFLLLFLISVLAHAQFKETLKTPRPGRSLGPYATGKNVFQIQTGVRYNELNTTNNLTHLVSLRYGIFERIELRSAFNHEHKTFNSPTGDEDKVGGLSFWNFGLRTNILNGRNDQPSLGLQVDAAFPWIESNFSTENIAPRIMVIYAQDIWRSFHLTTNWAWVSRGNSNGAFGTYTIHVGIPLAKSLGTFIENYGDFSSLGINNSWDTGLAYLVNQNLLIDFSTGYGNNQGQSAWFIESGFSWRIHKRPSFSD